jgi:hypothetical protein
MTLISRLMERRGIRNNEVFKQLRMILFSTDTQVAVQMNDTIVAINDW